MQGSFLSRLEDLTSRLPEIPSLHDIVSGPGHVPSINKQVEPRILEVEVGAPVEEWGIYKENNGAASVLRGRKGAVTAEHVHKRSVEYYIVLEGVLKSIQCFDIYRRRTITKTAEVGDMICIPKGIPHKCKFEKDTVMIVVTVPKDPDMPERPKYKGLSNE